MLPTVFTRTYNFLSIPNTQPGIQNTVHLLMEWHRNEAQKNVWVLIKAKCLFYSNSWVINKNLMCIRRICSICQHCFRELIRKQWSATTFFWLKVRSSYTQSTERLFLFISAQTSCGSVYGLLYNIKIKTIVFIRGHTGRWPARILHLISCPWTKNSAQGKRTLNWIVY